MLPGSDSAGPPSRRGVLKLTAAGLAVAAGWRFAAAQTPGHFATVDPIALPLDRPGVWTLNFAYAPIRIITVDVPGRGKKVVWFMVYQVWNTTDTPVQFVPEFELVTKDAPAAYLDEPQPFVLKEIRKIEDATGALNLHSSISISKDKIPVTKPDSVPRAVYGVAVWLDVAEKSPKTNAFSVYVTGLSNGLSRAEREGGGEVISRKTLQLDFSRPTDDRRNEIGDIRPNDNNGLGSEKWIYRPTGFRKPAEPRGEN